MKRSRSKSPVCVPDDAAIEIALYYYRNKSTDRRVITSILHVFGSREIWSFAARAFHLHDFSDEAIVTTAGSFFRQFTIYHQHRSVLAYRHQPVLQNQIGGEFGFIEALSIARNKIFHVGMILREVMASMDDPIIVYRYFEVVKVTPKGASAREIHIPSDANSPFDGVIDKTGPLVAFRYETYFGNVCLKSKGMRMIEVYAPSMGGSCLKAGKLGQSWITP